MPIPSDPKRVGSQGRTMSIQVVTVLIAGLTGSSIRHTISLNAQGLQTPAAIIRSLLASGTIVDVPPKGKVKLSIGKQAASIELPGGKTTVAVLRLPEYRAPYAMIITTSAVDTDIFIPSGLFFDGELQQTWEISENQLVRLGDRSGVATILLDADQKADRYLLLYTSADRLGQPVAIQFHSVGVPADGQRPRIKRALQGKLMIETKPR